MSIRLITGGGAQSTEQRPPTPPPTDGGYSGRLVVKYVNGELPAAVEAAVSLLAEQPGIVVWAGGLAQLHAVKTATPTSPPVGSAVIVPISVHKLIELLTELAVWEKWDSRSKTYRRCNCPEGVAHSLLARGYWPDLPALNGITSAPFLTSGGLEVNHSGLDRATGIFCGIAHEIPPMKGIAGRATGTAGIAEIRKLLRGFAFVDPADESAVIAGFMTALNRRLLNAAPALAISAPAAGSGKTMLAELIGIVANGRRPPPISQGADETELEKRIDSALLNGEPMILLDNITRALGSEDFLNTLLTAPSKAIRLFGSQKMPTVRTNATLILTGNSLSITGDLKRRSMLARLDCKTERPELRHFDFDPIKEAFDNRDRLIRAALEISLSYIRSGSPKTDSRPVGSFGEWDRLIRQPLIWHGLADPMGSAETLRAIDPEIENFRALINAWRNRYHDTPKTAAQVTGDGLDYSGNCHTDPELYAAIEAVCISKINSRRLGNYLRGQRDRILDGYQLRQAPTPDRSGVALWQIVTAPTDAVNQNTTESTF